MSGCVAAGQRAGGAEAARDRRPRVVRRRRAGRAGAGDRRSARRAGKALRRQSRYPSAPLPAGRAPRPMRPHRPHSRCTCRTRRSYVRHPGVWDSTSMTDPPRTGRCRGRRRGQDARRHARAGQGPKASPAAPTMRSSDIASRAFYAGPAPDRELIAACRIANDGCAGAVPGLHVGDDDSRARDRARLACSPRTALRAVPPRGPAPWGGPAELVGSPRTALGAVPPRGPAPWGGPAELISAAAT